MSASDTTDDTPARAHRAAAGHQMLWARPGFLVRRLHQIHVAMFLEACAGEPITPVQFGVLTVLAGGARLDQATLGMKVGIDRTNIADVVSRLEKRGLVRRERDLRDRRVRQVSITPEGADYFAKLLDDVERAQERFVAPLAPEERETFLVLLRKLVEANNTRGRTVLRARVK